jgi:hypothetical protein
MMSSRLRCVGRLLPVIVIYYFLGGVASQAVEKSSSYRAALESITAHDLAHYVDYLADESLEGREAGSRGGRAAADYLAEQLTRLHLRGAGAAGGYFQPFPPNYRNVLALLKGSDPELSSQVIVIGAHYDHVGYGTSHTSRGPIGYVHCGADDNASGTSGVLKLAEAFTLLPEAPKRSILFLIFDAEEEGLFGSKYWTAHPTVPLDHVTAMLDMDMVGRLRQQRLYVYGTRSAAGLRRLVSLQNGSSGMLLDFSWTLAPETDHYPFFEHGIPVLLFHTGLHDEYHSPRDVAKLINSDGMSRVVRLVFAIACELADSPRGPAVRKVANHETEETRQALLQTTKLPDRLGVTWEAEAGPAEGVRVVRIAAGSAAEKAQLELGDRIVRFAGREIHNDDDLIGAVRGADSPAICLVRRSGQEESLELTIPLAGNPMRLGITWRSDEAEPGAIILTHVVPGSPAAEAGLRVDDRIYQVGGHDFDDESQFVELLHGSAHSFELLVERDGQPRVIVVQFPAERLKRAA